MYNFPVAHLDIDLHKIYSLWKDKYQAEHLKKPQKNTVSVERSDLSVFNNEPWLAGRGLKPASASQLPLTLSIGTIVYSRLNLPLR